MAGTYPIADFTLNTANVKLFTSQRIPLILAQGLAAGSYISGDLITQIGNESDVASNLAGAGSQAQIMIDAFKEENQLTRLDAIIIDDNGSTKSTATATFIASPTEAGTLNVTVGSYIKNRYEIATTTTSTATTIAADVAASINADANSPVTALSTLGVVTCTAKNAGTEANSYTIIVEGSVPGITHSVTAFTGGATDPVLTGILDKIDEERYDIIAPYAFLSTLEAHLLPKFNSSNSVTDGIGFVCKTDSYANIQTILDPSALNNQTINPWFNKLVSDTSWKGSALIEIDYVMSTKVAALRALRFTDGAILNSFMVAGNNRGGAFMASIPYFNMKLNNTTTIPVGKGFTRLEILGIADLGGSTFGMENDNSVAITNAALLSSYKRSAPTATGLTYHYLNDNDTLTTARDYILTNVKNTYSQAALTTGNIIPNNSNITIANEKSIRSLFLELWIDLTGPDFSVLQGGAELQAEFLENLNVVVDTSTGSSSGSMAINRMGQLRSFDFDITPIL
jgi:hypothetical protein